MVLFLGKLLPTIILTTALLGAIRRIALKRTAESAKAIPQQLGVQSLARFPRFLQQRQNCLLPETLITFANLLNVAEQFFIVYF